MPAKLLSSPSTRLVLAAVAIAVLALGLLLRPHAPESFSLPSTEAPAPMLEELITGRGVPQTLDAVQAAARRVGGAVVTFTPPAQSPTAPQLHAEWQSDATRATGGGAGLLISTDSDVLTLASAVGGSRARARLASGREVSGDVTVYDPRSGLVIVKLDAADALQPAAMADEPPGPGDMVFAAGRAGASDTIAPMFVAGRDGDDYLLTSGGAADGAPLFTVSGRAFAIAGPAGSWRAYALGAAIDRLRRLTAEGRGNPSGVGVTFQPLDADLAAAFGEEGALVADVSPDSPAESAGLRAGDVVVDVAGEATSSSGTAGAIVAALPPWLPATFTVRRGRQTKEIVVTPERLLDAWWRGVPRKAPERAPLVADWLPAGLSAAHVSRTARLLTVNARTPGSQETPRSGAVLWVEDGGQRFFTRIR